MCRVTKIISGGQTGADQAGLYAAKQLGLATGGWAPKGWRTETGSNPSLKDFGLIQASSEHYPYRTRFNVADSDGTVIFGDVESSGSKLTIGCCRIEDRPFIVNPTADELQQWCEDNNIETLNVAGNRESANPGIYARVFAVLLAAFAR